MTQEEKDWEDAIDFYFNKDEEGKTAWDRYKDENYDIIYPNPEDPKK